MNPIERSQNRERKRRLKKQQKRYIAEERKSLKRERLEIRIKTASMRKRMRRARIEAFIKAVKDFFGKPIAKRQISNSEKFIRRKIKKDIRQRNKQRFYELPAKFSNSISRFWQHRFDYVKSMSRKFRSFAHVVKIAFSARELRNDYIKTMINSLALFLLSFLLVYFVHQFATILAARAFNIPTKLYSYRIDWPLYTYSYLYTRRALIVIFGMGPFFCLLLGIGAYRLFLWLRFRTVFLKTFTLWIAFHAFNFFFGAYVVGVITRTGFIYTSEWLFLSNVLDVEEIILMIVALVVLLIVGYYSTKQFLYASDSAAIIEPKIRIIYILSKIFIPWLAGNLILYIVNIPKNPLELILLYSTSALIVFPIFSNYNTTTMQMFKLPRVPKKFRIGWFYILLTIIIIFATISLLKSGISFY